MELTREEKKIIEERIPDLKLLEEPESWINIGWEEYNKRNPRP
jgi:hypothetical protein